MTPENDTPATDTPPDMEAAAAEMQAKLQEEQAKALRYLTKWNKGLNYREAAKILRRNREHPIMQAIVTVLRHDREECMEELAVEDKPDNSLRELVGEIRALMNAEARLLTIQMEEEEGEEV